ncbi:2-succinylbenzoate--CoA ligase isoform X3 [Dermacentor silvarum]|uniref:2-succinylbenzoate--CoA ligase isoform X3 n=1 Tax=Dermacentor silvarum TaxID=543639 RepID=UPI001897F208|nr:2-succinylbenzoate--CoA ligase isoform X3 [Dermacentor silvarum]
MRAKIEDGVVYSPFPAADIPCCSFYIAAKTALLDDPEKPALADGFVSLTRRELFLLMQRYAVGFQKHGVQPGDRVCVHINSSVYSFAAMWGCVFAGASIVLAKTSLTECELRYQLSDSDSTHILTDTAFAVKARKAASSLKIKGLFATAPADGFVSTSSFLNTDEAFFREVLVENPRDCVLGICYTSGTTGLAKGVVITHYGFVANMATAGPCFSWDASDVVLIAAPITHASGINCITFGVLLGAHFVIATPGASLQCISELVEKYKIVDISTEKKLGPNQTGEVRFRIPSMTRGYYKRPKETAELFDEDGWCKSGDAGYYDNDGRVYIVQRLKEMIKCLDNQVVPAEIEELVLEEHREDISEVVVVGLTHDEYGEAPAAFVVLNKQSSKQYDEELAKKIKTTVSDNLAVHKHLYGGVFFMESLPKTETGKVSRATLVEEGARRGLLRSNTHSA